MDRNRDELHPSVDPARWEAAVQAIMAAARPELERRAAAPMSVLAIMRWRRPILSAAATVALLASAAILARARTENVTIAQGESAEVEVTLAGALLPESVSEWLLAGEVESVDALVRAMEEVR